MEKEWNQSTEQAQCNNEAAAKLIALRVQTEHMLQNAINMTEMGMDLKEKCSSGAKYVCYLRSLAIRGGKTINSLQNSSKSFLLLAQKLANNVMNTIDTAPTVDQACYNVKLEFEKLLTIIEKELSEFEEIDSSTTSNNSTLVNAAEKIKYLEAKQKLSDNHFLQHSGSVKSVKSDVDEKYPENWSRDSLIDLNNVVNLPPVPEDIFTSFSTKPTRTSSLSSLKSMRKVKLFLQRAANNNSDDDDESSDLDEHDFSKIVIGDSDEKPIANQFPSPKKGHLGNIKEESQDQ